jgi:tRNA modification GTPase
MVEDTIVAVATAPGPAAVGIVRLSGTESLRIARAIASELAAEPTPRLAHLSLFAAGGAAFDQGLVLYFPAPHSYTGEDVVELQGHGGAATSMLVQAALAAGARGAEPGEFTQRAFLNGKLDLVQAEAVALLIAAQSERAVRTARGALGGDLSARVAGFLEELAVLRGRIEGLLDFPAESEGAETGLAEAFRDLARRVEAIASTYARGRRLFTRARVVLVGEVNAGKSSLLNALVGEERALVDAEPGTTRDLVEVDHVLAGVPVRLVDTAGWREAAGVEARGIARGKDAANDADLVLWVSGLATPAPPPEASWLPVAAQRDRHREPAPPEFFALSARTGEGLEALRTELARRLGIVASEDEVVVARERQARALTAAADALSRAAAHGPALELTANEAEGAARELAGVLGRGLRDDVMDQVFAQFCIGK